MAWLQHFRAHDEEGNTRPTPLGDDITTREGIGNIVRLFQWASTNFEGWKPRKGRKAKKLVRLRAPADCCWQAAHAKPCVWALTLVCLQNKGVLKGLMTACSWLLLDQLTRLGKEHHDCGVRLLYANSLRLRVQVHG